jgi:hypothetical protein
VGIGEGAKDPERKKQQGYKKTSPFPWNGVLQHIRTMSFTRAHLLEFLLG